MLGANGLLTVVHNESNGSVYANVGGMGPLMKGMQKRTPKTPLMYFTLSDIPDGDAVAWPEQMPEWVREAIRKSQEYQARFEGHESHEAPHDHATGFGDDDIPF